MRATKLATGMKSKQVIYILIVISDSFGKSWNDINKKEKIEPSPGGGAGGQEWKTLRSKILTTKAPPLPPTSQPGTKEKEGGDQLESLRTREEYAGPEAEGEDSLLKSFRNVGKAPRLLQRLSLCPILMKYFLFLLSRWQQQGSAEQLKKKPRQMLLLLI